MQTRDAKTMQNSSNSQCKIFELRSADAEIHAYFFLKIIKFTTHFTEENVAIIFVEKK